jgi:hypothetical protein
MTVDSDCVDCLAREAAWGERRSERSTELSRALTGSGRFEETYEWRISTYTTSGIERIPGGYRVWSETDGTWEAVVAVEHDALAAYFLLSGLQHRLFYAIGWASWVSATQLGVDDPAQPWSPSPRNECERYLARLWTEGKDRARVIAEDAKPLVASGESWLSGISTLRPASDPEQPASRTWVEAETSDSGLRFTSSSPTVTRAAEFIAVYEGLATDVPRELGWKTPNG